MITFLATSTVQQVLNRTKKFMRLLGGDVDVGFEVLLQLGLAVLVPVVYRDTDNDVIMATFLTDKTFFVENKFCSF
jgi:hypothetical protein